MYALSDTEHDAVLKLNADYRLAHFLSKFKEHQELFLLADAEGPFLLQDSSDTESEAAAIMLPVWSHPRYAEEFAAAHNLEGFSPRGLSAPVFKANWVPVLSEKKLLLAVMPLPAGEFQVLEPAELCPDEGAGQ